MITAAVAAGYRPEGIFNGLLGLLELKISVRMFFGATTYNEIVTDVDTANYAWSGCCIRITVANYRGFTDNYTRRILGRFSPDWPVTQVGVADENGQITLTFPNETALVVGKQYAVPRVYYAQDVRPGGRLVSHPGLSYLPQNVIVVGAQAKNAYTLAHEIGHVLGLPHSVIPFNLMFPVSQGWWHTGILSSSQCVDARKSGLLISLPPYE